MVTTNGRVAVANVLVVDDHPMIRGGIRSLLDGQPDFAVCGEAASVEEARRLAQDLRPDLIVLDLYLPDGDSLGLLEEVRSWGDPPKVIMLTAHSDQDGLAAQALRIGASGFVNKQTFGDEFLRILRDALAGETYLSPELLDRIIRQRGR